uniref:Putative trafficking protein particle complex subunit 13 homolog isoform X1 n=1 Tax=Rhizophora mucronata TaxID=61149 RepID=A0A2P2KNK8_RHIMU
MTQSYSSKPSTSENGRRCIKLYGSEHFLTSNRRSYDNPFTFTDKLDVRRISLGQTDQSSPINQSTSTKISKSGNGS